MNNLISNFYEIKESILQWFSSKEMDDGDFEEFMLSKFRYDNGILTEE